MKKKLEAELISIAHRILKLKNRAELDQLQQETLKLYEKLSVLKFVEDNFGDVKPTIGYAQAEEKLEEIYNAPAEEAPAPVAEEVKEVEETQPEPVNETKEEEAVVEAEQEEEPVADNEPEPQPQAVEETIEAVEETESKEEAKPVGESPFGFDIDFERKETVETPVKQKEISFEDFHDYVEPEFVKKDVDAPAPEEVKAAEESWHNWEPKKEEPKEEPVAPAPVAVEEQPKSAAPVQRSLNDALGKSINLGLNDRIAFEKHLFDGSGEDLNRVLSQLNTFDKFGDAHNFIEDLVKPDYNYWKGKEEYAERFMELVEKKFD